MDKKVFKASEIRYLWKHRGSKNYELKCFKATGNFITGIIFEDIRNDREVSGKLVSSPREGEAYHWPRLQHENLAPLFDVVSISEKVSVYMTIVLERSLRDIIHEEEFLQAPNCFERKKSYAEDVLWGLAYLHGKRLCLMNLNEANVFICSQDDKAVISDFNSLTLAVRAIKSNVDVPSQYRAPELDSSSIKFNAVAADMWACGVMLFQIFTGHAIPEACNSEEVQENIANFHYGVLVEANKGSFITSNAFISFQKFLSAFLHLEPSKRCTAEMAAVSPFLQKSRKKIDKRYGKLWEFYTSHQTIYSPEKNELESQSFGDPLKTLHCSYSSDIDSFKDNLKIHFPWNKFVNLNYVSSEPKNCRRGTFLNSLLNDKKNNAEISTSNIFDKKTTGINSLRAEKASSENLTSETTQTEKTPFPYKNNVTEITKNYFCLEKNKRISELKRETQFSRDCSSDAPGPFKNSDNLPKEEIYNTKFHEIEKQNDQTAIHYDYFLGVIPNENRNENQKRQIEETRKISSPLELSTGDCIGMFQKGTKQNDVSFANNEYSESKCTNGTQKNILELTNKLSPSSFLIGDSIGTLGHEIKRDNKDIYYSLLPEIQNDSDSDESNDCHESDFEAESSGHPGSESSWFKEEYNKNTSSNPEKNYRTKPNFFFEREINKHSYLSSYKNLISEFKRSNSDSTVNSSVSHSISTKSDPEINQHQSKSFKQTRESCMTVSSGASNKPLLNSTEECESSYYVMDREKSTNEKGGSESFLFRGRSSSFPSKLEVNGSLQKLTNCEIDNSLPEEIYTKLKGGFLLPVRSLTCHPFISANDNVLLPNKSEMYQVQKPFSLTNHKSETYLDVEKRVEMEQTKSLNKGAELFNVNRVKLHPRMLNSGNYLKNETKNTGFSSEIKITKSLPSGGNIFRCNRKYSNGCATMGSFNLKSEYENDGCYIFEGIPSSTETMVNQAGQKEVVGKECKKSQGDFPSIKDVSSEYEKAEQNNTNSSINLELDTDEEIDVTHFENSSFTEISLNSIHEPDGRVKQNKNKKKEKRRKSWLYRLCPGSKVYRDDKEDFFSGT